MYRCWRNRIRQDNSGITFLDPVTSIRHALNILSSSLFLCLQVPQMILEDCHVQNKTCRIFCTQPRRIAALTVADRVASERGETVGQTVGYQIRLENRLI